MNMPRRRFLQVYLCIILLLLTSTSIWSYLSFLHMQEESDNIVVNAVPISNAANDLLMHLLNQDTGVHGFILTSDETFLTPYYLGKDLLNQNLNDIKKYESHHPVMKQLIDEKAIPHIVKMQRFYESQITLVNNGESELAIKRMKHGKKLMDEFRAIDAEIEKDIEKIINDAWRASNKAGQRAKNVIIFGGIAALLAGTTLIYSWLLQKKLLKLSSLDGLTKLYNRRVFDEVFQQEWRKSEEAKESIALLLIDVDFFKAYNDSYGHPEGDVCLKAIATVLKEEIKQPCLPARYGGEEFAVILPDTTALEAAHIAQNICRRIEELAIPHEFSDIHSFVTVSIGVAVMTPEATLTPSMLVKITDDALYRAKRGGRNQVYAGRNIV
ncbi:hypothetical protein BTO30_08965 [Domibacillus antri]|uniref:GGDEF domain-containing protein n=1 Tax=Domibacillus antri TaxID=1714264 RepID=A0A1Q8Q573_9BACI|nr:diguanylate cyclase [Domibacillus antri]OLN22435.1 hypothetical protein BTO30_08965 [Domibacillus antri]